MFKSPVLCGLCVLSLILGACGSSSSRQSSAAVVNGQAISASAYNTQVTLLRNSAARQSQSGVDPCSAQAYQPFCARLKQTALDTLVRAELVRQYARQHHVAVSDAEFNGQWNGIVSSRFHGQPRVVAAYAKSLGLTVGQLKTLMRQNMLEQRVMYLVTRNLPSYAPSVRLSRISVSTAAQLNTVRRNLRRGTPFNILIFQMSHKRGTPCARNRCGEIGWYPDALISPAQGAILKAHPGQTVGPFASQFSLSLIHVEARNPHRPLTPTEEFNVRQRVFSDWLAAQERRANVHRYVAT